MILYISKVAGIQDTWKFDVYVCTLYLKYNPDFIFFTITCNISQYVEKPGQICKNLIISNPPHGLQITCFNQLHKAVRQILVKENKMIK